MQEPKAKILTEDEEKLYQDGLENLIAQLGTSSDKRAHNRFTNSKRLTIDFEELDALYRTNFVAGKIIDIIPEDMTREWREFTGEITPEQVETLIEEENRLELSSIFCEAHKWSRLYGTAYIIMSIDDGQSTEMPLNINNIKKGGLKHIKAIDRHLIDNSDVSPIVDPLNPNFGTPKFYRIAETNIQIHNSRVLRFDGVKIPYRRFREQNYNSDSVLDRIYDRLLDFETTSHGASSMVFETNVDVMKVKGLMNYLSSAEGEVMIRKRFTLASMFKSFNNMLILDNEEEFTTKTNTFSGLPDLLDRFALFLSAAADIPATRLFGSSASGLNATGEGDLKNYYDTIRSLQKREYKPNLDYFDKIMAKSLGLPDNIDLSYEFGSLFQLTEKEQAELELARAQRDQIYLDRDVVDIITVAKELKQNDTYTNITEESIEELEEELEELENEFENNSENRETEGELENEEGEEEEINSDK